MQFTLVVTSTKTRKQRNLEELEKCFSCRLFWETELWALSTTILLQDGPFLCLRLGLIIHYKIISQSNVFFTTKNFLVVLLQLYRVYVIIIEHRKRQRLTHFNGQHQLPMLPKKSTIKRKERTGVLSIKSNDNSSAQSISMTNLRRISTAGEPYSTGNTDPLPRRKRLSSSFLTPPPLPPPRPNISHSKSLTTVSLHNQKISTPV